MVNTNVKHNPNPNFNPNPNLNPYPILNQKPNHYPHSNSLLSEISWQEQLSPEQMSDHRWPDIKTRLECTSILSTVCSYLIYHKPSSPYYKGFKMRQHVSLHCPRNTLTSPPFWNHFIGYRSEIALFLRFYFWLSIVFRALLLSIILT